MKADISVILTKRNDGTTSRAHLLILDKFVDINISAANGIIMVLKLKIASVMPSNFPTPKNDWGKDFKDYKYS